MLSCIYSYYFSLAVVWSTDLFCSPFSNILPLYTTHNITTSWHLEQYREDPDVLFFIVVSRFLFIYIVSICNSYYFQTNKISERKYAEDKNPIYDIRIDFLLTCFPGLACFFSTYLYKCVSVFTFWSTFLGCDTLIRFKR